MLDFVLNLLIFFIITAIFVKEFGIDVARPSALDGGKAAASIQILIQETGEIFFNDRRIDVRAVRANVERAKAENPGVGVSLVASDDAATGALMSVVDQVRLGGLSNITFSTYD